MLCGMATHVEPTHAPRPWRAIILMLLGQRFIISGLTLGAVK